MSTVAKYNTTRQWKGRHEGIGKEQTILIAYCVEQFAGGHVQPRVVYTREQSEESAECVRAALEHHCAVQIRGEEPLAQPLARANVAGHELAEEHRERREQLVQRALALGLGGCAHRGLVWLDCAGEVVRQRELEEAIGV